jgi:Cdc6-like AAA superfamily ATPase
MKSLTPRPFSLELLKDSVSERLEYFHRHKINHPHLDHSFAQAMTAIDSACGPKVILVTGPTGVGKTTLARRIYQKLLEQHQELIKNDPGAVPVASFNAIPPNGSSFNWKDFYVRLLERHGDVLINRKLLTPRQHDLFEGMTAPLPIEKSTTEALRRATERCLKYRKTRVLIIDEAHHILMVNNPKRLEFQFEALKSLTIESDLIIVLVGTYRLLGIRDQSGQLVRRSEIVHFPHYDQSVVKDFAMALAALQRHLPLAIEPNLVKSAPYFYVKSGGCIGILKDWLFRCLESALQRGMETFDVEFTEEFALSNKSLLTILNEALDGEELLADVDLEVVKALLYRVAKKSASPRSTPHPDSPKRKRPVGERNPVRDETGMEH